MNEDAVAARARPKFVYLIIWSTVLGGLVAVYLLFAREREAAPRDGTGLTLAVSAVAPLLVSIVVRWLVLPKHTDARKALPLFIIGLATGEACGILGIFFGGPWADHFFALGLLAVVQYAPFLLPKLFQPQEPPLRG
ncbi:MAG TPA: hypothetical protein VEB66_10155 [Opitutaceae bacterium]|nr:hypothetical protein [Opitutaceae bacterium]